MVGPGCLYWLRFMGLPLGRGWQQTTHALEALRELRDVVDMVLQSGLHAGLEKARVQGQLGLLTAYDVQVQPCECKRGFQLVARVAKNRALCVKKGSMRSERNRRAWSEPCVSVSSC